MSKSQEPMQVQERSIKAPAGRKQNAIPTTVVLDIDAKHLLREMTTGGKSYGAFISGLLRAEWSRIDERRRLRRLLEE